MEEEFDVTPSDNEDDPAEFSDDEDEPEESTGTAAVPPAPSKTTKPQRRTVPGPTVETSATQEKTNKKGGGKRKKDAPPVADTKSKKTKAQPQISILEESEDEENATNVTEEEEIDPEETPAERRRRLAAFRLKVNKEKKCDLYANHCMCALLNGCHGCGLTNPSIWACKKYADRLCPFSNNFGHYCEECQNFDVDSNSEDGEIVTCPFNIFHTHCACLICCGCQLNMPGNQQCSGSANRVCKSSSYYGHVCTECCDYIDDKQFKEKYKLNEINKFLEDQ